MNLKKNIDYSAMFSALDILMAADLPQMELYYEIGRLVSDSREKGAAVAAAEYLQGAYPDTVGVSPRNLRRMRDFYQAYASAPEIMDEVMSLGWTQNIVVLEADLKLQERLWYIRAAIRFDWSKNVLVQQITAAAHRDFGLTEKKRREESEEEGKRQIEAEEKKLQKNIQKGRQIM